MLKVPVIFLCGMLAVIVAAATQRAYGKSVARARARPPLPVQVQRILRVKASANSANYLDPLGKALSRVIPVLQIGGPDVGRSRVFALASSYMRKVTNDLLAGASPLLLYRRVLAGVNLHGESGGHPGPTWTLGTSRQRAELVNLWFTPRIARYAKLKQWRQARHYEVAKLLLITQDAEWVGPSYFHWFAHQGKARTLLVKVLGAAAVRKLAALYTAGNRESKLFYSSYWRFIKLTEESPLWTRRSPISDAEARAVTGGLEQCIQHALRLSQRYRLLQDTAQIFRQFRKNGQNAVALQIRRTLKRWRAEVAGDKAMGKLERTALLRWINEASL